MDSVKTLAILAFCASAQAAALPQVPSAPLPIPTGTSVDAGNSAVTASAAGGVVVNNPLSDAAVPTPPAVGLLKLPAVPKPAISLPLIPSAPEVPAVPGLPTPDLPIPGLPATPELPVTPDLPAISEVPSVSGLPVPEVPGLPAVDGLPIPATSDLPVPPVPSLPGVGSLSLPLVPGVDAIPIPDLPGGSPLPIPAVPTDVSSVVEAAALRQVCELGSAVLSVILGIFAKGASLLPGGLPVPSVPSLPVPVPALAAPAVPGVLLNKRQLGVNLPVSAPSVSKPLGAATGLPVPDIAAPLSGATGALGGLAEGSSPLNPVTGLTSNLPGAGGLTSNLPAVGGVTSNLPPTGGIISNLPVVGGGSSPLDAVTGATGSSGPLGAITDGSSPLNPASGAVSGAVGTAGGAAGSIPVAGPAVQGAVSSVGSATNLNPAAAGIPNSDPVGAFSISVIATLLSLLKKDPLSLFAPSLPIPSLVKRDLPELHARSEFEKRQLGLPVPSLSQGLPGVGVGGLTGSGLTGISPDLASLVGSIAKNIAVPGGKGLGSVTGNILGVLNGIVPEFLFKLPVVHDSVPTFGVLQLLSSINPSKFSALSGLTNLASLQLAALAIPAGDLAFVKSLPVSPDPNNLITTIMTFSENVLSLPGNVGNLKAATSVLALKNLGLAVPVL